MATFNQLVTQLQTIRNNIKTVIQQYNKTITLPSSWKIVIVTVLKDNDTLDVKLNLFEPNGTKYTKDAIDLPSQVLTELGVFKKKIEDWFQDKADLSV